MAANDKTVLILGAGFGGLTAATELRKQLPHKHRVILVDQSPRFYECGFNLSLMTGEMKNPRQAEGDLSALAGRGVEFVNEEVLRIDPAERVVETTSRSFEALRHRCPRRPACARGDPRLHRQRLQSL